MQNRLLLLSVALIASGCAPLMHGYAARPHSYRAPTLGAAVSVPLPFGRWDQVMRLQPGSVIEVMTFDGELRSGEKIAANAESLRLMIGTVEEQIARDTIMRVDLLDAAGSRTAAVVRRGAGTALLGAASAGALAVLLGGADGFPSARLVGAAALGGGVYGAQAEIVAQRPHPIYLSPTLRQ